MCVLLESFYKFPNYFLGGYLSFIGKFRSLQLLQCKKLDPVMVNFAKATIVAQYKMHGKSKCHYSGRNHMEPIASIL